MFVDVVVVLRWWYRSDFFFTLCFFTLFFFFFISFWQEDRSCQERPKHVNQRSQRPLQKQREESEKVL